MSFGRIIDGSLGMMMFFPGTWSAGSPRRISMPFSRAKVSWAVTCLPAPVYSVSCTTTIWSSGISRAMAKAAVREVLPAGPRSRPSSTARASVMVKTSPWVMVTYRSM